MGCQDLLVDVPGRNRDSGSPTGDCLGPPKKTKTPGNKGATYKVKDGLSGN